MKHDDHPRCAVVTQYCHLAGQQVQVTAMPAGTTTLQVQAPQFNQQGNQVQLTMPATQQAPSSFSQQGRSQTSNGKGDERDFVRQASPQETTAAPSGDGINDPGVCLLSLTVLHQINNMHRCGKVSRSDCRRYHLQESLQRAWPSPMPFKHALCLQLPVYVACSCLRMLLAAACACCLQLPVHSLLL
jgi:hypothetical protein